VAQVEGLAVGWLAVGQAEGLVVGWLAVGQAEARRQACCSKSGRVSSLVAG
jgi:hypothetical protein